MMGNHIIIACCSDSGEGAADQCDRREGAKEREMQRPPWRAARFHFGGVIHGLAWKGCCRKHVGLRPAGTSPLLLPVFASSSCAEA